MKTSLLLAASIAVATVFVPALSALAAAPGTGTASMDTQHIVTLDMVTVRPSAEQRVELEAMRARDRDVVTLETVHVRPSAEQRAELTAMRARQQRVVTLATVTVSPSAAQLAELETIRQQAVVTLETMHVRPSPEQRLQMAGLSQHPRFALDIEARPDTSELTERQPQPTVAMQAGGRQWNADAFGDVLVRELQSGLGKALMYANGSLRSATEF